MDAAVDRHFESTLKNLLSRSTNTRQAAFEVIARHWQLHRQRITALADDQRTSVRLAASYLLSRLGGEQELAALRQLLGDQHPRVRTHAIEGLMRLNDRSATAIMVTLTKTAKYEELQLLMQAIAGFEPAQATQRVRDLARHAEWANRRVAAQTAGRLNCAPSVDLLVSMIDDEVWMVRADAVEAIGKRRCHVGLDRIRACSEDQAGRVRAAAVTTLGQLGHPRDFELAKTLALTDPVDSVRASACRSLAGFAAGESLTVLEKVLRKSTEVSEVRRAGLLTFLEIAEPDSRARLQQLITTGDPALRELAKFTLKPSSDPNRQTADRNTSAAPGK